MPFPGTNAENIELEDFDLERYQPMPVTHQMRGAILHRLKNNLPILPEIDGREETKADVIRALLSGSHPYLISEEGTGKTRLAMALTNLLPSIPIIKGCPYHDDPKWPHEHLCPRCRARENPVEDFGIELIPSDKRFSRVQGNEYTNEAKLLGLRDIQAIAHGKSPADPEVFTGTGVFRANRGILFVDELPSIRTKIQVLFHPILQEKKAILEEYNWQHPLDLIFVSTGNPTGYSHVNDIPRPLLDRLELIYMDLPEEEVERKIMLQERFAELNDKDTALKVESPMYFEPEDILRTVFTPWWIVDIVNKSIRHSRICQYVEKRPSIRASIRALEHTYTSVELESKRVANLRHAFHGLRLALRGRIGLRSDLIDFEEPQRTFAMVSQLTEDFIWNVFENLRMDSSFMGDWDRAKVGAELTELLSSGLNLSEGILSDEVLAGFEELKEMMQRLRNIGRDRISPEANGEFDTNLYISEDEEVVAEFNYSAMEMLSNLCFHAHTLSESKANQLYMAKEYV